jgi:trehalose 6-phosphate phosphatase
MTSSGTTTAPPPTPNSPLKSPAAVPIAASSTIRRGAMRRHTRTVSAAATLSEAIAPLRADPARGGVLLDIDGVLAPIVRHADDAHVPEPTRAPLIAVARRYGLVACVSGRQATTARRIVSLGSITYVGNHGAELLRGGATDVELDPEVAKWAPRVREFAEDAWSNELRHLRVRPEDKDVIRAFHWRGAPDEEAAEAAVRDIATRAEDAGLVTHWGRKVLEIRPPVELNKGRGVRRLVEETSIGTGAYVGDDTTDLDAFEALRALAEEGRLRYALCVGVRSDETPPALEERADLLVDGPIGVRALLHALAA